jgi:hypothetical protein
MNILRFFVLKKLNILFNMNRDKSNIIKERALELGMRTIYV